MPPSFRFTAPVRRRLKTHRVKPVANKLFKLLWREKMYQRWINGQFHRQ